MKGIKYLWTVLLGLVFIPCAGAKAKVDTLYSSAGDRVIISYDINRRDNEVTIKFGRPKKQLGKAHQKKFRKTDHLVVVFFDRTGGYKDIRFTGEMPQSFSVPSGAGYEASEEGYFFFYDTDSPPELCFRVADGKDFSLDIPFFLAYSEKKKQYRLLARCGELNLSSISARTTPGTVSVTRQKTTVVDLETDNGDITKVLDCIDNISRMLPDQSSLPLSETLEEDIKRLRGWQYEVSDPNLKKKVAETLDACEKKKRELMDREEQKKARELQQQKEEAQLQARQEQEREEARIEAQKQDAEKTRKRNTWMMIMGGIVAVLAFVGNQVLQNLRSKKNQLNILKAQESISQKAEAEAKRKAQNAIRSATRDTVKKTVDSVEKKMGSVGKKKTNKKYSI